MVVTMMTAMKASMWTIMRMRVIILRLYFVATAALLTMIYQLSFADATYVLHQYRHLFPCVPTSDAAW